MWTEEDDLDYTQEFVAEDRKTPTFIESKSELDEAEAEVSNIDANNTAGNYNVEKILSEALVPVEFQPMKPNFTPIYPTGYISLTKLHTTHSLIDTCLKDHTINGNSFYINTCECYHLHAIIMGEKIRCPIGYHQNCEKCGAPTRLLIESKILAFHPEYNTMNLNYCDASLKSKSDGEMAIEDPNAKCVHTHNPPCHNCESCFLNKPCIFSQPFECRYTTLPTCKVHNTVNKAVKFSDRFKFHKYLTKSPKLFYCKQHNHKHSNGESCDVNTVSCCKEAKLLHECDHGFVLVVHSTADLTKKSKYVIYNPKYWESQAHNYFYSLLRAAIVNSHTVKERYKCFKKSKFSIGNINDYKSGKTSIIRKAIIGFYTKGLYQTAIISNTGSFNTIILPVNIWNLMQEHFDMNLGMIKRDPTFYIGSMSVCKIVCNDNPKIDVIILPNELAKLMNQDQDGDRNTIYFLPKMKNGYDFTQSATFKFAKMEMAKAHGQLQTLIAEPRISFSECDLTLMYRGHKLLDDDVFFNAMKNKSKQYMLELGCSIRQNEFKMMYDKINYINSQPNISCVTVDDLMFKTTKLTSIIDSGAKGSKKHIELFVNGLRETPDLDKIKQSMIAQFKRYISSSKNLSLTGRSQFTSLYAIHDLIILHGVVCLNKIPLANYRASGLFVTFMFNQSALDQTLIDLEEAED